MTPFDQRTIVIPSPPKGGRIEKYLNKFQNFDTSDQLVIFMGTVFTDTLDYLDREQKFTFPEIRLSYYYRQEEWDDLIRKLEECFGKKPDRRAMVVRTSEGIDLYINVLDHWSDAFVDFIINLCSSFIEELVHVIYPLSSETQIQKIVCTMLEGFIEVKLPDEVKEARLKNSKKYDESI
jgi:hypothetical protein